MASNSSWRPAPFIWLSLGLHLLVAMVWLLEPSRWPLLLAVLGLDHALLTVAGMWPRCGLLGPNLVRLPALHGAGQVALTFDDGPDPKVTPAVLELLDRHGARASFFLIGERAERYPELVREIVSRGHRVENHTQRHPYSFAFYGLRRLRAEIDQAQRVLTQLTGRAPEYFRAPAGIRSPLLEPLLAYRRLRLASWTRRAFDTIERDPHKVARRLLRGLRAGDVLLLHDGSAALDSEGRAVALGALPQVLQEITARGLRAVPLPARSRS